MERVVLENWALQFRRVLTIVKRPGAMVPGALYRINTDHERALDRYEGWPTYYDKEYLPTASIDNPGKSYKAMVYILNKEKPALPSSYYLNVCLEGADDWDISRQYLLDSLEELRPKAKRKPKPNPREFDCRCGGAGACMECNPGMFITGPIRYS